MSAADPVFNDIVDLLDELYNNDPNIGNAPHGTFWHGTTRDAFVKIQTDNWGVAGPLVTLGQPSASNLYLALSGTAPFDGSNLPQMPDTGADPNGRHATAAELQMVSSWITNKCP